MRIHSRTDISQLNSHWAELWFWCGHSAISKQESGMTGKPQRNQHYETRKHLRIGVIGPVSVETRQTKFCAERNYSWSHNSLDQGKQAMVLCIDALKVDP